MLTILAATFVIALSFALFFYLFANILISLIFDIPATIKLGKKNIIKQELALKKYAIITSISSVTVLAILGFSYYLFIKYSFGFSISLFIGAALALLSSSWKAIGIFFRYSDSYLKWLDLYRNENSALLETFSMDVLDEALGGKPGELERQTNKLADELFQS